MQNEVLVSEASTQGPLNAPEEPTSEQSIAPIGEPGVKELSELVARLPRSLPLKTRELHAQIGCWVLFLSPVIGFTWLMRSAKPGSLSMAVPEPRSLIQAIPAFLMLVLMLVLLLYSPRFLQSEKVSRFGSWFSSQLNQKSWFLPLEKLRQFGGWLEKRINSLERRTVFLLTRYFGYREPPPTARIKALLEHARKNREFGVILNAMRAPESSIACLAVSAFTEKGADLRPGDWAKVDEAGRDGFRVMLASAPSVQLLRIPNCVPRNCYEDKVAFHCALLHAVEQFGGQAELEIVSLLAQGKPARRHWYPPDPRVAQAAADCMPYLEQAASEARPAGELLRAAATPSSGELLRPGDAASEPSEELLRGEPYTRT